MRLHHYLFHIALRTDFVSNMTVENINNKSCRNFSQKFDFCWPQFKYFIGGGGLIKFCAFLYDFGAILRGEGLIGSYHCYGTLQLNSLQK